MSLSRHAVRHLLATRTLTLALTQGGRQIDDQGHVAQPAGRWTRDGDVWVSTPASFGPFRNRVAFDGLAILDGQQVVDVATYPSPMTLSAGTRWTATARVDDG